jgi:hypothetical protein
VKENVLNAAAPKTATHGSFVVPGVKVEDCVDEGVLELLFVEVGVADSVCVEEDVAVPLDVPLPDVPLGVAGTWIRTSPFPPAVDALPPMPTPEVPQEKGPGASL